MAITSVPARWVVTEDNLIDAPDVFPELAGVGWPVKYPEFSTMRREAQNGRRVTNARWSVPRWNFKLTYEVIRNRVEKPELSRLWGFFLTALGAYGGWFYHDPSDDTVTGGTVGVGDGTTTDFQCTRTLAGSYGFAFNDPVYAFWKAPQIFVNGSLTGAYTIQAWGVIRFDTAPASGAVITWTGKFLFPCEFTNDKLNTAQMFKDLFSEDGIEIRTIKP